MGEFDKPLSLLEKSDSLLSKMVEKTGPVASRKLRQMAEEAARRNEEAARRRTSTTRVIGLSLGRETTV